MVVGPGRHGIERRVSDDTQVFYLVVVLNRDGCWKKKPRTRREVTMRTNEMQRALLTRQAVDVMATARAIRDDVESLLEFRWVVSKFIIWADHHSPNQHEWTEQVEILRKALQHVPILEGED